MDAMLLVLFVVVVALAIGAAILGPRVPKPAPKPAPKPEAKPASKPTPAPPKSAVSSATHDLGGGVVIRQVSIDRFAIAPSELHPDEPVPGRSPLAHAIADELLRLDDDIEPEPDAPPRTRAVALVAPLGSAASSVAYEVLHRRRDDAGAVMLELGASGRAKMDVDVAKTIFVHLFEMEARLSLDEVRARYAAKMSEKVGLHLRDCDRAQLDALAPPARAIDGANVIATTTAALALPGVVEHAVPIVPDDLVRAQLAKAKAPDPSALVPLIAGHASALRLVECGLYGGADTYARALDAAKGEGLARILAATLSVIDPELATMARALAILPTSFDLPTAEVVSQARDERAAFDQLARLIDTGILVPANRDKFNRERAELRPVLRPLLRAGADDLAERALVLEMSNRLLEEEQRFLAGPSKRAPALYLLGLEWPSFDLARTIARARFADHATFAKAAEIFEKGAPKLFAARPAMARAWGR